MDVKQLKNKFKSHYSRYMKVAHQMDELNLTSDTLEHKEDNMKTLMLARDYFATMKNELKNMLNALKALNLKLNDNEIDELIDDDFTDIDQLTLAYKLAEVQYLGLDYQITGSKQSQIKLTRMMDHDTPELRQILEEEANRGQ